MTISEFVDPSTAVQRIQSALTPEGLVIATLRRAWPNLLAIHVFGSRANGQSGPDSDLDLAVLVAGYADPVALWDMAQTLAMDLGCEVDLLDLRAASTVMQYQVLTTGRTLWAQQPDAGLFDCFVMSEKLELDVARAGLLSDIARDGSIHGR